jgi:pimeloyl-ACP methyl ester carboxylesterase
MTSEPPPIPGVRRSFVEARGVRFHVTESGPEDGRPVLALHGWPQHHWAYNDLLADPPPGLRIIAPDLPGFGWSGPAPHKWAKEDVASDVLALLDALGLDRVLLAGHDWGAYAGYLMILRASERFDGYLAMNMGYPWVPTRTFLAHALPLLQYQPLMASFGVPVQRYTNFLHLVFKVGSALDREIRWWPELAVTPTVRSSCASCQVLHGIPKYDARPFRFARSSGSRTTPFTNRGRHPKTPSPTTSRWRRSTRPTSSSMSSQTWCGRGSSRWPTKRGAERLAPRASGSPRVWQAQWASRW